jgi:hypothetical protein
MTPGKAEANRADAKALGDWWFYGLPCPHGHDIGRRLVLNSHCLGCERIRCASALQAAKAAGATMFNSGLPCPKGHLGERYVSSNSCATCTQINSRAHAKKRTGRMRE